MITDEEGKHYFEFEFILHSINYEVKGSVVNMTEIELDEQFQEVYKETETTIELLSATYGDDFEFDVTDTALLKEIEAELYKY